MKRGSALIAVLLLLGFLMVLGMALLSKQTHHLRAATRARDAEAALELALAGLEEVRVKLDKDLRFPALRDTDQMTFSYQEEIFDIDGGPSVGFYIVRIDRRWEQEPYEVWRIRVEGVLGALDNPRARRLLEATFDRAEFRAGSPNPNYFEFIDVTDHGSL